jgi:VanZ family protein
MLSEMLRSNRPRPPIGIEPWLLYSLLLVAYLVGIYWLSSLPGLGVGRNPVIRLVLNLFHIPLFAGLAFCFFRALSWREGRQQVTWRLLGLTFLVTGALAGLDEWHQSFVPGRQSNMKDFLLDLLGIGGMLLILRLRARRQARPPHLPEDRHTDAGDAEPPGDRPDSCLYPARSATGQ